MSRGPRPSFGAKHVVGEVRRRIPFTFNTGHHAEVGRRLGVRAGRDEENRTLDAQYAEWFTAMKIYLYSQQWIDRLVAELSEAGRFEELTGKPPVSAEQSISPDDGTTG